MQKPSRLELLKLFQINDNEFNADLLLSPHDEDTPKDGLTKATLRLVKAREGLEAITNGRHGKLAPLTRLSDSIFSAIDSMNGPALRGEKTAATGSQYAYLNLPLPVGVDQISSDEVTLAEVDAAPPAEPVSADHPVLLAKPQPTDFQLGKKTSSILEEARHRAYGNDTFGDDKPGEIDRKLIDQLMIIRAELVKQKGKGKSGIPEEAFKYKTFQRYRAYREALFAWEAKHHPN